MIKMFFNGVGMYGFYTETINTRISNNNHSVCLAVTFMHSIFAVWKFVSLIVYFSPANPPKITFLAIKSFLLTLKLLFTVLPHAQFCKWINYGVNFMRLHFGVVLFINISEKHSGSSTESLHINEYISNRTLFSMEPQSILTFSWNSRQKKFQRISDFSLFNRFTRIQKRWNNAINYSQCTWSQRHVDVPVNTCSVTSTTQCFAVLMP